MLIFLAALFAFVRCDVSDDVTIDNTMDQPSFSNIPLPSFAEKQGFQMGGNTTTLFKLIPETKTMLQDFLTRDNEGSGSRKTYNWNGGMGGSMGGGFGGMGGSMGGGLRGMGGGFGDFGGGMGMGGMTPRARVQGVQYIGRGYNLIDGNPDIVSLGSQEIPSNIATDPGMRTAAVFNLTWRSGDLDAANRMHVPDQVLYFPERSCYSVNSQKLITGMKSHQKQLRSGFDKLSGFSIPPLVSRSFMGGQSKQEGHGESRYKQSVHQEKRHICTYASARYRMNGDPDKFILNDDFKRAACQLPSDYSGANKQKYHEFLNEFGTSVIIGASLGALQVMRMEVKTNNLLKNALSGKIENDMNGGSTLGVQSMLNFNFGDTKIDLDADNEMVKHTIWWQIGSAQDPKPTKLTIINMHEVFADKWWHPHCRSQDAAVRACCSRVPDYKQNIRQALEEYGEKRGVEAPTEEDDIVTVPLNWPRGYYTLPATEWGCGEKSENMKWEVGVLLQTTHHGNEWSKDHHMGDVMFRGYISQRFCTKNTDELTSFDLDWEAGTYCILRKGNKCPKDFQEGWIYWDDKNIGNENGFMGILPDGVFNTNTRIEYCCRDDDPTVKEINLPNKRPFYLMMYGNECQRVRGMKVIKEWVHWDSWDLCVGCSRSYQAGGKHPRNDYTNENNKLYYCYYEPRTPEEE